MNIINQNNEEWALLSMKAWEAREKAYILGNTKVGASLLSETRNIYTGCNIEHIYRSHDIHAEVNVISSMIASGDRNILKILIVAERDFFTPCGGCMDWIMQFAIEETLVGFQNRKGGEIRIFNTHELMPFYPK